MDIDERDIEKGSLPEILPKFYPSSISYLSELNDYRMYAEVWSNKTSKANAKRMEIGHAGYLKTLQFGESKKKRKSDKVRFDSFFVADSLNYRSKKNVYGEVQAYLQMGGIQTNSIFNKIIKAKTSSLGTQPPLSDKDFHSKHYLPETVDVFLDTLDLSLDGRSNEYYFEISTNSNDISNQYQKMLLSQILGRDGFLEKLKLLYSVERKYIRCLFENPENVIKSAGMSNAVPRLCVARPFSETIVFDFAGTLDHYKEGCLLGTLIMASEDRTESVEMSGNSQIDGYA